MPKMEKNICNIYGKRIDISVNVSDINNIKINNLPGKKMAKNLSQIYTKEYN